MKKYQKPRIKTQKLKINFFSQALVTNSHIADTNMHVTYLAQGCYSCWEYTGDCAWDEC